MDGWNLLMFAYPGFIILQETIIHVISKKQFTKSGKTIQYLEMFERVISPAVLIILNIAFFVSGFNMTEKEQLQEFVTKNNLM